MTVNDILIMEEKFDIAEELYQAGYYDQAYMLYEECEIWFNRDGSGKGDAEIGRFGFITSMLDKIKIRCIDIKERNAIPQYPAKWYILTKSKYVRGLQCTKALWLDTYDRKKGVIDEEVLKKFAIGRAFEARFKETFHENKIKNPNKGNGFLDKDIVDLDFIQNRGFRYSLTMDFLNRDQDVVLFEAGFIHDKVLVQPDVVHKQDDKITIYEIKSGTKLTNAILQDLSVQYFVVYSVLKERLTSFNIVLNDGNEGFKIVDITDVLKNNKEIVHLNLEKLDKVLEAKCPDINMGKQCTYPYSCEFQDFCKYGDNEYRFMI